MTHSVEPRGNDAAVLTKPSDPDVVNPPPVERPLVVLAIEAVRAHAGMPNRDAAAVVLGFWTRFDELTAAQIGVVLRRFPAPPVDVDRGAV